MLTDEQLQVFADLLTSLEQLDTRPPRILAIITNLIPKLKATGGPAYRGIGLLPGASAGPGQRFGTLRPGSGRARTSVISLSLIHISEPTRPEPI
eukprot:7721448-Pyramimonas_sp.AAC.1